MIGDSTSFRATDYTEWDSAGLDSIQEAHEMTYCNQYEDGFDVHAGEWFIADDDTRTIISGTFGNYNSPGASHYTYAERYELDADYRAALAEWEEFPEYLEEEPRPMEDEDYND